VTAGPAGGPIPAFGEEVPTAPPKRAGPLIFSPSAMLVALTALLLVAFVWWRLSAQRTRVESYWGNILIGAVQLNRDRSEEWLDAQRKKAELLGVLAARGRGPGSAFEAAVANAMAEGDIGYVSIRDGDDVLRCTGIPLAERCGTGSTSYVIPSPGHPQARRVRPVEEGRKLIAAVGTIPPHDKSPGGVVTLWLDPERALFPRLLRTIRSTTGARTEFVNLLDADSATVLTTDLLGVPQQRRRIPASALPGYARVPFADNDWTTGTSMLGEPSIIAHSYIPSLRWEVYRVLPYKAASAPFRRELVTDSLLAFVLGSFVIGLAVWGVRERREQGVRAELMQVRLESLQAQLRPHFLFNALNTIATLIHEDPKAADAMLIRLADLLRLSLEHSDDAEIPLRREIELFDAYIAVERVRFGKSLAVSKHVTPEALDMPVMRWLLQPLAENAIKHGAAYTRGEARMELRVSRADGMLEIVLADDGPNPVGPAPVEGVGLRNTRQRLATLYGDAATLLLRKRQGGGTEAVLRIPEAPAVVERVVTGEEFVGNLGLKPRA
jgi:hypothetical protein